MKDRAKTWSSKALCLALCLMIQASSVHASFLDEFYNNAGATMNVTPPTAMTGAHSGVISGGSLVYRAPSKNFRPFSFKPPSFNAGCGGIDFFLGSFGFASKQEFINFMRNVVQNSAGLAFRMALTAMSPLTGTEMKSMVDEIQQWNRQFGDSCKAAESMFETVSNWTRAAVESSAKDAAAEGTDNYTNRVERNGGNGKLAIRETREIANSGNEKIKGYPLNLVWKALGSADGQLSMLDKRIIMSAIGTVVLEQSDNGAGSEIIPFAYPKRLEVTHLIGDPNSPEVTVPLWDCGGGMFNFNNPCTEPVESEEEIPSVAYVMKQAIDDLTEAILTRQPLAGDSAAAVETLFTKSSLPMLKIVSVLATPRNKYLLEMNAEKYALAISYEIALRNVDYATDLLLKFLSTAEGQELSAQAGEYLKEVRAQANNLKKDAYAQMMVLQQQLANEAAWLDNVARMEKALYTNIGSQMEANLRFSRKGG